jgi:hypothetical protein
MWRGYPVEGYHDTCWLTGLQSTRAKVEGIMLKAACHWGSDSRVINNPSGEPGHTPLYVGLPSVWASMDHDRMFFPHLLGELLNWGLLTDMNERSIGFEEMLHLSKDRKSVV